MRELLEEREIVESKDDPRVAVGDTAMARRPVGAGALTAAASPRLAGLPQGFVLRPLTAADLSAVYHLEAAGEAFDDEEVEVGPRDLETDWRRPGFDLASMSVRVFQGDDLAAYATVFKDRAEALVRPENRGRGMGEVLMRWTWEVARAEGRDRIGQTISENELAAQALFRNNGYEHAHTSWILRIDLDAGAVLPPPALPEGYGFSPYCPGARDREIFALIDTAFEEWRGLTSESEGLENWAVSTLYRVRPESVRRSYARWMKQGL